MVTGVPAPTKTLVTLLQLVHKIQGPVGLAVRHNGLVAVCCFDPQGTQLNAASNLVDLFTL